MYNRNVRNNKENVWDTTANVEGTREVRRALGQGRKMSCIHQRILSFDGFGMAGGRRKAHALEVSPADSTHQGGRVPVGEEQAGDDGESQGHLREYPPEAYRFLGCVRGNW